MIAQTAQQSSPLWQTLLPAIIGFFGALVGAFVAGSIRYLTVKKRVAKENERAVAQAYLEYRVEALNELQRELHNCKRTYISVLENTSTSQFTEERHREILEAFEQFESAYDRVRIVFEDEEKESSRLIGDIIAGMSCGDGNGETAHSDGINDFYELMMEINKELKERRDHPVDRDSASSDGVDDLITVENLEQDYSFSEKYESARQETTTRLGQPLADFSELS